MIEVTNLTRKYGDAYAIENLNFTIEKGKVYGFLGPNGAGKSTTMNILTGYIAATEGTVVINGHDILKEPGEARACIGYLPEQPPLYQDMTVREYLDFAAELKGIDKEKRKQSVDEAMETLVLEEMSGRLIKNLSKGYKQRVGFAQALLGVPEILILDEPTVGLDPKQIIEIRSLIKELGKKHTVILSSHILSEVSEVCDHIMIISKGKLVASDSTEDLIKRMQPVTILRITAVADSKSVEKAISGFETVTECLVEETDEPGVVSIEVKYDSSQDLRMKIAKSFTENGCTIIEMNTEKASLEDIFLELTAEDEPVSIEEAPQIEQELTESVDEFLNEHGYGDIPEEQAYGPGDAEAEALSDFADELAGGRDRVINSVSYEYDDVSEDSEATAESPEEQGEEESSDDGNL